MKKRFFAGFFVLMLLAGLLLVSCDETTYSYTFKNQTTSYTIKVECEDLDPSLFTLTPGASRTATSTKASITYFYSVTDGNPHDVKATKTGDTVTFLDND